jgi:hypothetical protein
MAAGTWHFGILSTAVLSAWRSAPLLRSCSLEALLLLALATETGDEDEDVSCDAPLLRLSPSSSNLVSMFASLLSWSAIFPMQEASMLRVWSSFTSSRATSSIESPRRSSTNEFSSIWFQTFAARLNQHQFWPSVGCKIKILPRTLHSTAVKGIGKIFF